MMYFVKLLVLMLACFAQAVPPPIPSRICINRLQELVQEFASQETIPDIESYVQTNSLTGEYHFNKSMVDDYCSLFRKVVPFYENNIAALRFLCNTDQLRHYLEIMSLIKNIAMSLCDDEKMKGTVNCFTARRCVFKFIDRKNGEFVFMADSHNENTYLKALLTCFSNNHIAQHGFVGCLQGTVRGLSLGKPDSLICTEDDSQSWFTSAATGIKSCFCQFDACAPESTSSITEMLTSHQTDVCKVLSNSISINQ